jgi:hypothetical protein
MMPTPISLDAKTQKKQNEISHNPQKAKMARRYLFNPRQCGKLVETI